MIALDSITAVRIEDPKEIAGLNVPKDYDPEIHEFLVAGATVRSQVQMVRKDISLDERQNIEKELRAQVFLATYDVPLACYNRLLQELLSYVPAADQLQARQAVAEVTDEIMKDYKRLASDTPEVDDGEESESEIIKP